MYAPNPSTYDTSIELEVSMFIKGHVPTHKGRTTTTDPVKDPAVVAKIKALLADDVRELALWTVAINSALRSGDLCALTWDDTRDDGEHIEIHVLEGKTKKPRVIPLNAEASRVLRAWRAQCDSPFIYSGQRGQITVATWGRMVKAWCEAVGLTGNFSGHTARKTFVRIQHDHYGTSLPVLMTVLNHSSERQTLTYMGRLGDDVVKAYGNTI
jgi:integrase